MRIAIFGAGSIGCYVGGHLLANGQDVTLFGRDRLAEVIAQHGLTLSQSAAAPISLKNVPYETDLASLASMDVIILTVKSQDTVTASKQILDFVSANQL